IPPTPAASEAPLQKHIVIDEDQNQQYIPTDTSLIPLTKTSSVDSDAQSVMTAFSVSNTNSLSRVLNRLRGDEPTDNNKDFWMPDEQCKECYGCNAPFNLFRRKHHCRTCGRIFCSKCLSNNIHTSHSLRVCNECYIKYVEGYRADDTISLHDGYSYSSVVDANLASSLQQQQQKTLVIPSGDDESSDEELEFERSTNSFDLQRPPNLELHFSQSTSSHHTASDTDIGIKKLLTNTFLRAGAPRSRTSTMNSLGIDTSAAALEGVRQQQQMNSPMPFRRNSFITSSTNVHQDTHNRDSTHGSPLTSQIGGHDNNITQQSNDFYEVEDDDLRRWDKNPRNLLNFLGERPSSGIFNNIPPFFFDDYAESPSTSAVTPMQSTSTSTIGKASSWFMHRPLSYAANERSSIVRRRLSLTEGGSSSHLLSSSVNNNNCNNNNGNISGSPTSSTRHIRVRTKSLMRNNPITMSDQNENGYESSGGSNRNSFHQQQLTSSISTPTTTVNRSSTPDMELIRSQILSTNSHPVAVVTHEQWDASYIHLLRNIIQHLLDEAGLSRQQWEEVMISLLLKIVDEVQPNIRVRDTFNMNHYVKVKKVPGGLPQDSFSVSGVVFSKSVAHKDMMRTIKNPSVLILNFDVDGFGTLTTGVSESRQEYLKFDRLLAWERDHMNALVSKIVGLKPSIVLISSNVPRTVIECLNKHKIVVAYNVKKQKLDAIARCADATVFNYKNELWNAKTITSSKCGLFEPMTIMHEYLPNRRKTFLMFHECPKERGATIVLRGGDLKTLHTVKFIMNFMVKVVNNINLEAQLRKEFMELRRWHQPIYDETDSIQNENEDNENPYEDDTLQLRGMGGKAFTVSSSYNAEGDPAHIETQSVLSVAESQITVNTIDVNAAKKKSQQQYQQSTVVVEDDDICLTAINAVLKQYQNTTLSISAGVTLPVPHILIKLRESQKKLIGLIRERLGVHITGTTLATESTANSVPTSPSLDEKQPLNNKPVIPPIPTDLMYMPDYLKAFDVYLEHDLEYRHYQELHLQSWLLFKKYIGGIHQYLSPIYHQQILVRRTTNPMDDHTIPCEKAALDPYDYYNPMGDCTLGQYILNSTKEAYSKCSSKMCGGPLIFHDRTYSHGNAQVKVQVRDEYLRKIPIFICTHCNICNVTHDWRAMPDLLQRYSFGKFLELLFYQSEPIPIYEEDDYFSKQGQIGCPHGFYRDHTISFRIQNLSVNFTHAMVKVVEVQPPPLHLRFSSKQQMAIKDATLDSTRSKIARFFDSIIERNKQFSYDIVQPNMVDLCKEYLQEMSQEALKNKKSLLQKLQMEYATSAPTDTLQLNNVLAELQNHAVAWDLKYIDFARRFVRPERELRRLTANHLRRMFPAESLYSNNTSNLPAVSNLSLRTKKAIEAADLPLLDVGLDSNRSMPGVSEVVLSEQITVDDYNMTLKEQPSLGESPTESYPWYDELKRFDQMFLQDKKEDRQEILSLSIASSYSYRRRRQHHSHNQGQRNTGTNIYNMTHNDSSTSNLLSLSPGKNGIQFQSKQEQEEDPHDLDPSAKLVDVPEKTPSTPIPISTKSSESVNVNQSKLVRHTAALPLLSSTTYKRLAGLLPEPMVHKSRSSPSPGNYLPSQQQRAIPYQKLIDNKAYNRKSQLNESSVVEKSSNQTPPTKPNFYRGSPYTTKIQDRSPIAYRYGFMGGLNSTTPVERRLGATSITHPI
ncbi:1-phosphatidylinositol-3-phosphate 5-kinase, partial [Rhizopus stolonifer]